MRTDIKWIVPIFKNLNSKTIGCISFECTYVLSIYGLPCYNAKAVLECLMYVSDNFGIRKILHTDNR